MDIETDYLKTHGPTTATHSYSIGGEEKYKVGDKITGVIVVSKLAGGDRVCVDRSKSLCPTCVASGWAAKLKCEIPMKDN